MNITDTELRESLKPRIFPPARTTEENEYEQK